MRLVKVIVLVILAMVFGNWKAISQNKEVSFDDVDSIVFKALDCLDNDGFDVELFSKEVGKYKVQLLNDKRTIEQIQTVILLSRQNVGFGEKMKLNFYRGRCADIIKTSLDMDSVKESFVCVAEEFAASPDGKMRIYIFDEDSVVKTPVVRQGISVDGHLFQTSNQLWKYLSRQVEKEYLDKLAETSETIDFSRLKIDSVRFFSVSNPCCTESPIRWEPERFDLFSNLYTFLITDRNVLDSIAAGLSTDISCREPDVRMKIVVYHEGRSELVYVGNGTFSCNGLSFCLPNEYWNYLCDLVELNKNIVVPKI